MERQVTDRALISQFTVYHGTRPGRNYALPVTLGLKLCLFNPIFLTACTRTIRLVHVDVENPAQKAFPDVKWRVDLTVLVTRPMCYSTL